MDDRDQKTYTAIDYHLTLFRRAIINSQKTAEYNQRETQKILKELEELEEAANNSSQGEPAKPASTP